MEKVAKIEREVQELSAEELAKFREWFAAFNAEDVKAGKLDSLADRALRGHAAGKSTKL